MSEPIPGNEPGSTAVHSKILTDKYQLLQRVGEGGYGVVYRARRKDSQALVAIKEIKMHAEEEGVQTSSLREISLLLDLRHPNVVRLHEVLSDRLMQKLYIVLDYLSLDLHQLIRQAPHLMPDNPDLVKEGPVIKIITQLLQGLAYCHSRRVIHRDIKPQNMLIDVTSNTIKLADFGLARTMGLPMRSLSPQVVTMWYRPPEVLLSSQGYSAAVDMWSMGCVFYELATSRPLFPGTCEIDQLFRIISVLGLPTEATWPGVSELSGFAGLAALGSRCSHPQGLEAVAGSSFSAEGLDLLQCLIQLCPDKRITAKAALRHSYFRDIQNILNNPPRLMSSSGGSGGGGSSSSGGGGGSGNV